MSSVRRVFLFLMCAFFFGMGQAEEETWPKEVLPFLEALTSQYKDWNPHRLGREQTAKERALLEKFKPKIFIGPKSIPPVDFYKDYLPNTLLKNDLKEPTIKSPSRKNLKAIERIPGYYLDYKGKAAPCVGKACVDYKTALYGRVFYETMSPYPNPNHIKQDMIILKYTAAFSLSGLPADLKWWKTLGAAIGGGSLKNWHELDIHGAIQILLDAKTKKPVILLLAQHNHFRSYLIGKDVAWPRDNAIPICFAERSNEPYICPEAEKKVKQRTVGDPRYFRFVILGEKEPLEGGVDVVYGTKAGAIEIGTALQFLPWEDPLYTSWISLGDKQKILGLFNSWSRRGPPGINMNTWPVLKKYTDMAQFWYFTDGDREAVDRLEKSFGSFFELDPTAVLEHHSPRVWEWLHEPRSPH